MKKISLLFGFALSIYGFSVYGSDSICLSALQESRFMTKLGIETVRNQIMSDRSFYLSNYTGGYLIHGDDIQHCIVEAHDWFKFYPLAHRSWERYPSRIESLAGGVITYSNLPEACRDFDINETTELDEKIRKILTLNGSVKSNLLNISSEAQWRLTASRDSDTNGCIEGGSYCNLSKGLKKLLQYLEE